MKYLLAAAALFTSVTMTHPVSSKESKDYTVLDVNGHKIQYSEMLSIWGEMFPHGAIPDYDSVDASVKQNMVRGLVGEHLIYQSAEESGVANKPEVQQKLARLQKKVVVQAFLDEKAASKVTPSDVKAEYDRRKAKIVDEEEVRASHILVEDEATAKKLLEKLKKGANFDALAKEQSTDKASAVSGGDLGFFTKEKMVPAFADAAFKLKKDELSAPVKSGFGWHIIKLTDKRKRTMRPFVEERLAIEQQLRADALAEYIDTLVSTAKVDYFDKDGKKLDFSFKGDNKK